MLIDNPFPWQVWLLDLLKLPPDDRTIHYVWDPEGSIGKSKIVKYLDFSDD